MSGLYDEHNIPENGISDYEIAFGENNKKIRQCQFRQS